MALVDVRAARAEDLDTMQGVFRRASLSNIDDRAALLAHPEALTLSDDLLRRGWACVATLADGTVVGYYGKIDGGQQRHSQPAS